MRRSRTGLSRPLRAWAISCEKSITKEGSPRPRRVDVHRTDSLWREAPGRRFLTGRTLANTERAAPPTALDGLTRLFVLPFSWNNSARGNLLAGFDGAGPARQQPIAHRAYGQRSLRWPSEWRRFFSRAFLLIVREVGRTNGRRRSRNEGRITEKSPSPGNGERGMKRWK